MTPEARQLRRLLMWNRFWLALLVVISLASGVAAFVKDQRSQMETPTIRYVKGGLRLEALPPACPLVVTGFRADDEWTVLPSPVVVLGSAGGYFSGPQVLGLTWRDERGAKAPPPGAITAVTPLYCKALSGK